MRKIFAQELRQNYLINDKNSVLLGDISVGLFLDDQDELVPNAYNMGILEQSMISFAAGLSTESESVFVHTISPFIIERGYEQIKLDLSYNKNKVILVSANGPFEYNKLGPTHHCSSDVPLLNLLPCFDIYVPGRDEEVITSLKRISNNQNAAYLRLNNMAANHIKVDPNKVINNSTTLNIFVGETVNKLDKHMHDSYLYLYNLNDFCSNDISPYETINVYEPYSVPILGSKIKIDNKDKLVTLKYYPQSIEDGIFNNIDLIEG